MPVSARSRMFLATGLAPLLWFVALATPVALSGCASNAPLGSRAVSVLGAGVMNDPSNKSLRFDI